MLQIGQCGEGVPLLKQRSQRLEILLGQEQLPALKTCEWAARICSVRVVPERGSPTMNTGCFVAIPKPRVAFEELGSIGGHQPIDETGVFVEIIALSLLAAAVDCSALAFFT